MSTVDGDDEQLVSESETVASANIEEMLTNTQGHQTELGNDQIELLRRFSYTISAFLVFFLSLYVFIAMMKENETEKLMYEKTMVENLLSNCRSRECNCPTNKPKINEAPLTLTTPEGDTVVRPNPSNAESKHAKHVPGSVPINTADCDEGDTNCDPWQDEVEFCDLSNFAVDFGLIRALKVMKGTVCDKEHIIQNMVNQYHKKRRNEALGYIDGGPLSLRTIEENERKKQKYNKHNEQRHHAGWKKMSEDDTIRNKHMHREYYDD